MQISDALGDPARSGVTRRRQTDADPSRRPASAETARRVDDQPDPLHAARPQSADHRRRLGRIVAQRLHPRRTSVTNANDVPSRRTGDLIL